MERFRTFDFRKHMPSVTFTLLAVALIAGAGAITVYLGLYNIAADAPHNRLTYSVIETFREKSIAARSGSIAVPADLAAPARLVQRFGTFGCGAILDHQAWHQDDRHAGLGENA